MTEQDEHLDRLFRALGDTTRRKIIEELAKRERQSLFEIYTRVIAHGPGQTRQGFSRHLGALEKAGIITVQWQGTTKLHTLDTGPINQLGLAWLTRFKGDKE